MAAMDEDDVRRFALALPLVTERRELGDAGVVPPPPRRAQSGTVDRVTVKVEDDGERRALAEQEPGVFTTTDHHAGTNLVLVTLTAVDEPTLAAMLAESWWWAAPPSWRRKYPETGPPG